MIIVTGGAGLIGSAVVWQLNRQGREDVVIVDHLGETEKWRNLAPLRFRDYLEKDDFLAALRGPLGSEPVEAVIHLGACSSTTECDASYLIRNNFEYSKHLANFALQKGARFIYASSAATYGDGALGFCDDETTLPQLRPLNAYGYSKQLFDLWLQRNALLDRAVGLKYFNVFGPNEHHKGEMRSVVLKAYEQIAASGAMTLFRSHHPDYADGEQLRDFVYVKDAVNMTLFFLENRAAHGIFNVGTGKARSWNDLGKAIFAALGRKASISYIDMPEQIRPKYQYYTCADAGKISAAGYSGTTTPLEDSVADYVRNYLVPGRHLGDEVE
ncbi:ADP-glyceromanno-heptose 6-epimerase [Geomesophilobacter sediminis]|uniref:ADP-L-glycero-D-manno-heptose-6-epimerase n=1 Tax=Geomesophilobacter sediminis TaxID=2798584 RepID=A0A8J7IWU9_9BACT|nr:ADP-glyceromanno-heptose 6-epimerase [Geomesophilobacter sediminis]MBJ6724142.1 ADP-glyceromanno-heptose 6-epimerase [Geomesophilobacter sediminis]